MSSRLRETVAECLAQAQSDFEEVQLKALKTLASLTKVSPQNRNLLAQTDGAIFTFLDIYRSTSSNIIQFLSHSILFNLSLNSNLKQPLADTEMIHHLNSIIIFPSCPESGKLAASLICSLAMLDKNKAVFGVAGTIQALVKSLEYRPSCIAAHHILSSLAELVKFHGNSTLAVRAGAIPVLIEVVKNTETDDAGTALSVLVLLGRFKEGIDAIRNTEEVVSLMVDVLKRKCMLSKEGSAEILLRLFDESEDCVRDAVELPDFSSLVADLSVRGSAMARDRASLLMKKMMEVNMDSYFESHPMFYC